MREKQLDGRLVGYEKLYELPRVWVNIRFMNPLLLPITVTLKPIQQCFCWRATIEKLRPELCVSVVDIT
jgi:hypothetical protein